MLALAVLGATLGSQLAEPIRVDGVLAHPTQILVKYVSTRDLQGLDVVRTIPQIHWAVVRTKAKTLRASRTSLSQRPGILEAAYDRAARPAYTPNDPKWEDQWHSRAIKADLAWDISLGTNTSVVAVLDTGVQVAHPDLAANIWVNTGEIPGNGVDDDANGFVDDVNGFDFVNNDGNPDDDNGHGTACAGLVGGVGDNGIGVSGVAPRTRIMAIKVGRSDGYFFDSATVPSYVYAADRGAKVFSMSYYADSVSIAEQDAMNYAVSKGVLPIAAAGNDNTVYPFYPGAYEKVLSVAALDTNLNKASFSDFGSWVDVAAPGVSLRTTARNSSYTDGFSGTSGACPQVSGLAGLLFGANPGANAAQVRRAIEDSATLQNQAPFGEFSTYGLVNAQAAMVAITSKPAPAKTPKVVYITPIGQSPAGKSTTSRIYGRNLAKAEASAPEGALTMKTRTRNYADFVLPSAPGPIEVRVKGGLVASYTAPVANDFVFPLIEGSTKGATLTGGYAETLNQDDAVMELTRRSDQSILLEGTFRRVPRNVKMTLVLRSRLRNATQGNESIQLYNWSGGSYPYNTFDSLASRVVTNGNTVNRMLHIPNIAPYVDFNGTVYLRISATGLNSGTTLQIDQAYLRRGYH